MAAELKKAPITEIESTKSSAFDASAPDTAPVGEAMTGRSSNLDVRAQTALLHEAFKASDPLDINGPAAFPSPQRTSFVARYGRRAVKSALGLCVLVIAGVGPVQ